MANPSDNDFFKLLAEERQSREGPAGDQIVFRDADGKLKILKEGKVYDYNPVSGGAVTPLTPKPVPPEPLAAKPQPAAPTSPISRQPGPAAPFRPPVGDASSYSPAPIDSQIRSVISRSGLKFGNEEDLRRFKNIVTSGLRNVRDQIELKEALTDEKSAGGMNLTAEQAQKIIALVYEEKEAPLPAIPKPPIPEQKKAEPPMKAPQPALRPQLPPEIRPTPPQPAPKPPVITPAKPPMTQPVPPTQPPAAAKPAVPMKPQAAAPMNKEFTDLQREMQSILGGGPTIQQTPAPKPPAPTPVVADVVKPKPHIPIPAAPEPKIEKVKYQPKLVGPIEEIRSMTLVDFRRLAPTPAGAAKKIMDKIELLEQESFAQRHQAIKAWHENEISRLYIELGEQAMEEKKPISDIIAERAAAKQPTLSDAELEAVIELNQQLRY